MRRLATLMVVSLVAGALVGGGAEAQGQSCGMLQAELMRLLSQGQQGGFGDRTRYERAYREQETALYRTEQEARRNGCSGFGFFLFRREVRGVCSMIMPRLRQMQENLARLDRMRRTTGINNARRIRQVRAIMAAADCNQSTDGGLFRTYPDVVWGNDPLFSARGTYRTLCVRTCDGYYFPISFATVPDQFTSDAQTCQAMCPGTASELYYYPNPGGGPESMVSVTGTPYSSLPTAFRYRQSFDAACTCRPAGGYPAAAAAPMSLPPLAAALPEPTAPLPRARPAPGEDPETLADRAGGLLPQAAMSRGAVALAGGSNGKPVRIVGPVYWGAPEKDSVVITPVPN